MRRLVAALAFALVATSANAQVDPPLAKELAVNAPGSSDQLLPRYAGSFVLAQTKKDFDELVLPLGKVVGSSYSSDPATKLRYEKMQTVEGRLTRTVYVVPEGRSTLEVVSEIAAPDRTDLILHRLTEEPSRVRMEACGVRSVRRARRQAPESFKE